MTRAHVGCLLQSKLPGIETINFKEKDTLTALRDMTANEPGHAPDVVIEAVGFHYCKSWLHTIEVSHLQKRFLLVGAVAGRTAGCSSLFAGVQHCARLAEHCVCLACGSSLLWPVHKLCG